MRLWIVSVAMISACTAAALPTITDSAVERAQTRDSSITRADLEAGRATYVSSCGDCHEAYHPATRTPPQWELAVAEMSERAHLHGERQALVLKYLTTFAR